MMKFSDFGFKENPFSITPDPRYLYLSRGHEESLAHLIYGTGPNGGFVLLTGEVGTGKTLLIRSLLAQQLSDVDIALVLNPRLSRREFIATICDELGIVYTGHPYSLKQLIDSLTKHLLQTHGEGRHTVLVVDEAQNLSPRVLEQVRLLTNLETTRHKLLRIILVGQPELLQMLARKELRQVDQRITARYHLSPLERQETAHYITHRLAVAGIREDLFTPAATRLIHRLSGGVPRRINTLCERALLAIYSRGQQRAGMLLVWQAAREVKGRPKRFRIWRWSVLALLLITAGVAAYLQWSTATLETGEAGAQALLEPARQVGSEAPLPPPNATIDALESSPPVVTIERIDAPLPEPQQERVPAAAMEMEIEPPQERVASDEQIDYFDIERLFRQPQTHKKMYQLLFALWGESFQPQSHLSWCVQAPMKGLRCLQDQGDWQRIETLNRPLLLRLVKDDRVRLLLLRLKEAGLLVVDDGNGEALLEVAKLQPYWAGRYMMLWRPPEGVALIGDGSSGKAVTWLRQRLRQFDQHPYQPVAGLDRFDDSLKQRLQAFQRAHGLLDDGVAGQQTLIYLNNLELAPETPRLQTETGKVEGSDVADS